jgi:hypothetical protein
VILAAAAIARVLIVRARASVNAAGVLDMVIEHVTGMRTRHTTQRSLTASEAVPR